MAAGTIVSRLSGFVRGILLAAALGVGLHADVFNIANTVPNMLYILLAGGVVNAVLVPQLVRAMKNDPDGGEAYTNRIITLAGLFLGVVTVLLVVAAPLLMRLFLDPAYFTPALAAQRDSVIAFARYCLPQVFFYGMFVLVGQVLNSRGRFGPMMWAPIANNVVAVAVLVDLPAHVRPAPRAPRSAAASPPAPRRCSASARRSGIVVQFLVLLPYLRARGLPLPAALRLPRHRARPHPPPRRVDGAVRGGQPDRLHRRRPPRLAAAPSTRHRRPATEGTGYTVYSNAFLLSMVPHSIITVSLATAMLPLLSAYAADGDLRAVGDVGRLDPALGATRWSCRSRAVRR